MKGKIKIGIVEDEMIISETIAMALKELGYLIAGVVGTYNEAVEMVENTTPDLVLLDINLGTKKDGIDLAFEIKRRFGTPIIFLTANSDATTISRAKEVNPLAFLVKPFSRNDLFSAIEIGWNNFNANASALSLTPQDIVLKVGTTFEKVAIDEIIYLKNDQHYFNILLTSGKNIVVRYSTKKIMTLLPAKQFVIANRFYIINVQQVTKIDVDSVLVGPMEIAISKKVRKELLDKI